MLSVKANGDRKYPGRNRAGMFFPRDVWVTLSDVVLERLTPEQRAGLLADPLLEVREGPAPDGSAAEPRALVQPQAPEAEQAPDYGRCEAETTKGRRCRNKAASSGGFCSVHLDEE